MNIEQLKKLIEEGESERLEFKKSTAKLGSAMETLCGFLNGAGGTVLFGVADDGKLVGQDVSDSTKRELAKHLNEIEPATLFNIDYVDFNGNKKIISISVESGEYAPYVYESRPFQRTQSCTKKMSQHHYEQLIVKRGHLDHAWENSVDPQATLDDLDQEEIYSMIHDGITEKRIDASIAKESKEKILRQLNLTVNGVPKRAAVVLFGKNMASHYIQCRIKMARFKGTEKLGDFIDHKQIHCNLFSMLKEAEYFLHRHLPTAGIFSPGQLTRIDKLALPMLAMREALVNAVCHRDYSNRSGYVSIAIFNNRLEIWNNGKLPNELKLADLKRKHDSVLRNALIGEILYLRKYIEAWGTGTNKMLELCQMERVPLPTFSERSGGFLVTFTFSTLIGASEDNIIRRQPLDEKEEEILELLKKHGPLSASDINSKLSTPPSLRTTQANLLKLKTLEYLEQIKKGPKSVWKIKS